MRWLWRRRVADPPQGVRLILDDGTVIRCGVVRDPDLDEGGCAGWVAIPVQALPVGRLPAAVEMDVLPAKTTVDLRVLAVLTEEP